ncbi:hypothetical protein BDQ17DRAFT_1329411 [Cyathus striatus]|nr:hypothetical protein BDQ17DRAFT_1329411 [Cyathus striatus]
MLPATFHVLNILSEHNLTVAEFLLDLLHNQNPIIIESEQVLSLAMYGNKIYTAFSEHPTTAKTITEWMCGRMKQMYTQEIVALTDQNAGFHFGAKNTTQEKLCNFSLADTARKMKQFAPALWDLLSDLLDANPTRQRKRKLKRQERSGMATGESTTCERDVP